MSTSPIFTRYLYEFELVKHSLQKSLFEKQREEALFWAYELYHSGLKEEVWEWIRQIYLHYYSASFSLFDKRITKMYAQWKETGDSCLLGTVVGTISMLDREEEDKNTKDKPSKQFIILYKDDRHQTIPVNCPPRHYLKQVSKYPIRGRLTAAERDAYLGTNWLYYCAKTPIWETRIREYRGTILERNQPNGEKEGEVAFNTDDDLESFYDKWGLEPDEQSLEMHTIHGVYL
jgi:hypothetical protein